MRYAVLADIHGNAPGLEKVLEDANAWGAEGYLFLGDYTGEFPWPNEVIDRIQSLKNAVFIGGNREDYIAKMTKEDPITWVWNHQATLYWNMEELTKENKAFLLTLPEQITVEKGTHRLYLAHRLETFLPKEESPLIYPADLGDVKPFVRGADMSKHLKKQLMQREELKKMFDSLDQGIYLFGHNHMPWLSVFRQKIFINPGAIGLTLDGDYRLSYIRLELGENRIKGKVVRLPYDREKMVRAIRQSTLYQRAWDWAEITIENLYTARDEVHKAFLAAKTLAKEKKIPYTFPLHNQLWNEGFARWRENLPVREEGKEMGKSEKIPK
ncbi:MAG: hypothetical protein GX786_03245 [Clostridiales bacterium]|nr:hypothetical protein [Clostridiales bacterium]